MSDHDLEQRLERALAKAERHLTSIREQLALARTDDLELNWDLASRPETGRRRLRHQLARLTGEGWLVCAECDQRDDGMVRGCTMRLDIDDKLVIFCPDCDEREFGDV
jgi:hypothetical protein